MAEKPELSAEIREALDHYTAAVVEATLPAYSVPQQKALDKVQADLRARLETLIAALVERLERENRELRERLKPSEDFKRQFDSVVNDVDAGICEAATAYGAVLDHEAALRAEVAELREYVGAYKEGNEESASDANGVFRDLSAEVAALKAANRELRALHVSGLTLDDWHRLHTEVAALKERLNLKAWFDCPDCGTHVKADEDGLCATCGAECCEMESVSAPYLEDLKESESILKERERRLREALMNPNLTLGDRRRIAQTGITARETQEESKCE